MSEPKLLDGTALAAELHELSDYYGGSFTGDGIRIALDAVKRAKAVDVEKHGRWIARTWYDERAEKERCAGYRCSNCWQASAIKYPHCPGCGARMDEVPE